MSLLMKALEKAAKDRGDNGEPNSPAGSGLPGTIPSSDLTLEPIAAPAAPAVAPRVSAPQSGNKPATAHAAAPREPAQAAALIRAAQREPGGNIFSYLRDRPLIVFGILAMLFIIGFGGYVYVEMNPGLFAKQAPRPAPIAQVPAPAAATAVGAASGGAVPAAPVPLSSLLPQPQDIATKEKSAPSAAPAAAIIPAAVAAPTAPAPQTPRDTIKVTSGSTTPTVNPVLADAYGALTAGNLESSQRLYNQLLKSDAGNVEALLGLAAIDTQQGDRDAATRHYVKVLELDPRNSFAQAGLINMLGGADPASAETRVKQLIARDPSAAYLHFTLGNTYVDQNRWPDAQQAFFQAHHLQPDNPDYAYNLAVALEHIGQTKSALDFYRRAVQLAATKGHANFSPAAAQERVSKLEKFVQ
jgi:tetratricopeptide (TPR) repeat protein